MGTDPHWSRVLGLSSNLGNGSDRETAMTQVDLEIKVECYAGYRGEQSPRRFVLGKRTVEVSEELDRWLAPDYRYFKVLGDDGGVYILRHDSAAGCWELTLFGSAKRAETRLSST